MPIATSSQYAAMLDDARAGGWALPAVNVTSSQTLIAVLQGLAEARSDGIVQVTTGGGAYLGGDRKDDPAAAARGAAALAAYAHEVAASFPTLVALHTDHCTPDLAESFLGALLERTAARRAAGLGPLFHSHMFDGSMLPLAENLQLSARWLKRCSELDVILEVECGVVGGEEDGVHGDTPGSERLYTTNDDLLAVAETLGTGERGRYLLAATFGNVHGVYAPGNVQLRPEILRSGQEALAAAYHGAQFEYVFHGSSGTPPDQLHETLAYGVVKVNVDTEMQHAFTGGIVAHVGENAEVIGTLQGAEGKKAFDPRAWGRRGQAAMAERVVRECEALGCAGRTLV
jgi:fructose-bisphosphate aldolase, class II